jgi:flagellar hook-length control protein FliK
MSRIHDTLTNYTLREALFAEAFSPSPLAEPSFDQHLKEWQQAAPAPAAATETQPAAIEESADGDDEDTDDEAMELRDSAQAREDNDEMAAEEAALALIAAETDKIAVDEAVIVCEPVQEKPTEEVAVEAPAEPTVIEAPAMETPESPQRDARGEQADKMEAPIEPTVSLEAMPVVQADANADAEQVPETAINMVAANATNANDTRKDAEKREAAPVVAKPETDAPADAPRAKSEGVATRSSTSRPRTAHEAHREDRPDDAARNRAAANAVNAPPPAAVEAEMKASAAPTPATATATAANAAATAVELPKTAPAPTGAASETTSRGDAQRAEAAPRSTAARTAAATDEKPPTGDTAAVDRVRFVQRVANAFRAMGDHNSAIRLKLSPPQLGSLRMEIVVQKGVMTARLEAETVETRNLLLDNLPALRERLAQQDIRIETFQVELADRRLGDGADHAAGQSHGDQERRQGHGSRPSRAETAQAVDAPGDRRIIDHSQLNVII